MTIQTPILLGIVSTLYGYLNSWVSPDTYTLCSNNAIYTVDPNTPTVDCVGVSKGQIMFVGKRGASLFALFNLPRSQ